MTESFVYMKYNKEFIIFGYSIFFTFIYLFLKKGLIYSSFGDQLWSHTFLYGDNFILENDIFGFAGLNKSLWIFLIRPFTQYFSKYTIFYTFMITHHVVFFYFILKIFNTILPGSYTKMFLFGFIFVAPTISTSGSGSVLRELGFIYRSTSFVFIIIAFYYFLKNRTNSSILLSFFASLFHLPTAINFYIYISSNVLKLKKSNIVFLIVTMILIFCYSLTQLNIINDQKIIRIAEKLIKFRQGYLYIHNWQPVHIFTYLLFYISLIITFTKVKKESKPSFFLFVCFNLFYFISVTIFNYLNFLQVFKYGREIAFIMIIISTQLVCMIDEFKINFKNILIMYAILSMSIFGSIIQFLIIYIFLIIFNKKFIINDFFKK